jgi:predicted GNAT family acetyltransferase
MEDTQSSSGVLHEPDRHRFVLDVSNGRGILAFIEYSIVKGNGRRSALDLYHTYVPPEGRGRGIAGQLTKAAFEYAQQESMAVVPTCSYVSETFLNQHPEYRSQVALNSQL